MTTLSPAEHRAQAEKDLDARNGYAPATDIYKNLTQSAIAHTLAAVAYFLEPVPEPPAPQVPGLPLGWTIGTSQNAEGERWWRYELQPPQPSGIIVSRYRWGASEAALAAGIRYANDTATPADAGTPAEELEHRGGRTLSKEERIEARHWLQQLSEQARDVRNAMDPVHGMLAVTDDAWRGQWQSLKKSLDEFTTRVMLNLSPLGGIGDRNS